MRVHDDLLVDDRRRLLLGVLPRPPLLRMARLHAVRLGPGFAPTPRELRLDELAAVARHLGADPHDKRWQLVLVGPSAPRR